ncbi:MAG: hypothetical protein O4803_08365 [Trichodesmium sp. St15_bin1_1]|jgi:hypothetical protein|nr:hypothetical protein [Trichodesmium sp. MAG_R02]MDE5081929.1 hypothetical protein [Trichodesmium sp. St18_bin1]MDE5089198.1 hypothetical protein [Trichodesmium sp. St16_bin2-tuft]MDE5109019.1 hypothetical protein [Trichodesmium sp. St17_bin3_1_1]MDE5112387.1 hypothetical protein [Trichodesmium sp. St7_bin2_1]MDE5114268.1 hypothetical protein [Trichodesmium sp. St15_bin1_1]MDE5118937.1 hypothetical protein [Trichodesmium sp. St19_bin1]
MLKYILIALITLELILLSGFVTSPANGTMRDSEIFIWDYASLSNYKVVCKKMIFHPTNRRLPESSDMKPINIHSQVVNDEYCSNLTKPV